MSQSPIGIFDSGIGGLTVCKAIHDRMPDENIIYYGDTARFPYGTRSKETIIRYSREITEYLLSRGAKIIVVACNTVSAAALSTLRDEYSVPFLGVIEAGARAACTTASRSTIGVIATRATVSSEAYAAAIHKIDPTLTVLQQQATLFVPVTEEGLLDHPITRETIHYYLDDIYNQGVRTIILGCTHFPLLKEAIMKEFPDMKLVDTGTEIALDAEVLLQEKGLENRNNSGTKGSIEIYASDITETMNSLKDLFFNEHANSIEKLILNG
jgi:glutamate racemase